MKLQLIFLFTLFITGYSETVTCSISSQHTYNICWQRAVQEQPEEIDLYIGQSVSFDNVSQYTQKLPNTTKFLISISDEPISGFQDFNQMITAISEWQITEFRFFTSGSTIENLDFLQGVFSLKSQLKLFNMLLFQSVKDVSALSSILQSAPKTLVYLLISLSNVDCDISVFTKPVPNFTQKFENYELSLQDLKIKDVSGISNFFKGINTKIGTLDLQNNEIENLNPGTLFEGGSAEQANFYLRQNPLTTIQTSPLIEQTEIKSVDLAFSNSKIMNFSEIYPSIKTLQIKNLFLEMVNSVENLDSFPEFSVQTKSINHWYITYAKEGVKLDYTPFINSFVDVEYFQISFDTQCTLTQCEQDLSPFNSFFYLRNTGQFGTIYNKNCYATVQPKNYDSSIERYYFYNNGCSKEQCPNPKTTCQDCSNDSQKGQCENCIYGYQGPNCISQQLISSYQ